MKEKVDKRGNKELSIKKIIKATEEVIEKKGYINSKIKDISKKADVSIGLIYKYFPKGKPEIVIEVMKRNPIFRGIRTISEERMNQMLTLPSEAFVKAVQRVFIAIIKTHRKQAKFGPAVERAMQSSKELYAELYELSNNNIDLIPVISRILKKFNYPKEKVEQRSQLFLHTVDSLIHRHTFYGEIIDTDEELAEYLTELFLKLVGFDKKFILSK